MNSLGKAVFGLPFLLDKIFKFFLHRRLLNRIYCIHLQSQTGKTQQVVLLNLDRILVPV